MFHLVLGERIGTIPTLPVLPSKRGRSFKVLYSSVTEGSDRTKPNRSDLWNPNGSDRSHFWVSCSQVSYRDWTGNEGDHESPAKRPRKFIRSMDGAKSGVLVKASHSVLLPDIIGRSSSETRARNASFLFIPVLHFLLLESKWDLSYLESFRGVLRLLFFRTFFSLPRDRSTKRESAQRRKCQTLRPNGNEQRRNYKMRSPGHPHFERRVEGFGLVAFPAPSSGGAMWGVCNQKSGLKLSPYQRADS
ncbi:hypothetical protein Syun_001396 [Stephania yunnanensis]|uniref:Uncharacterized protein n=1 Tax=Stephania yunnanensis TaxID=152371 RepID=A0AAP0QAV5_9MAGN